MLPFDCILSIGSNLLETDTDKDGLSDWDEITLDSNPKMKDTDGDGIPDNEEVYEQKILETCFDEKLLANNEAIPSLSLFASGNASADVEISAYNGHLKGDSRFFVGEVIEISGSEIEDGQLEFKLSKEYEDKADSLLICYNDGEQTVPLETGFDKEALSLKANIPGAGIYFVLETEEWLASMGLDREPVSAMSAADGTEEEFPKQADIVFLIETGENVEKPIYSVMKSVLDIADELELEGINSTYSYVLYQTEGAVARQVQEESALGWFSAATEFRNKIATIIAGNLATSDKNKEQALAWAKQKCSASSSQVFFVYVTEEGCEVISEDKNESLLSGLDAALLWLSVSTRKYPHRPAISPQYALLSPENPLARICLQAAVIADSSSK